MGNKVIKADRRERSLQTAQRATFRECSAFEHTLVADTDHMKDEILQTIWMML